MVDKMLIASTMGKMDYYLSSHNSIAVGVSGGSDSNIIVHMIATHFREYLPKVHFVFSNTGLEYRATLRHIEFLEKQYDIKIDRIKGESVVSVVHRDGVPIVSKEYSKLMYSIQKGQQWAIKRLNRTREESPYALSEKKKQLAHYLLDNDVKISSRCCDLSKKHPHKKYLKSVGADLTITGERKCEGGQRASCHKSCFETGDKYDKYMPLWFWNDETKQWYKEHDEGYNPKTGEIIKIRYSDCYEIWGMKRTGCVGCPFNSRVGEDLKMIQKYEPALYNACMHVFGESYRLMDRFNIHRIKILQDEQQDNLQTTEQTEEQTEEQTSLFQ